MSEIKTQVIIGVLAAVLGATAGALSTYALVWRDVAVIKFEIMHITKDINEIQEFVANDDPTAWLKAKRAIRAEQQEHAAAATP